MRILKFFFILFVFHLCFLKSPDVRAEISVEEELKTMKTQMQAMQQRISELETQLAKQQNVSTVAPVVSATPPLTKWLPEIGVVADTVFRGSSNKINPDTANRLSLRELELVFGSAVDPFSRLDATISFSDTEDLALEEGYLTYFGLPAGITARFGKFKPKIGKMIPVHRDSLDNVDEPLVIQRYFGAEGYNKAGIDFTKTLDIPWPLTHQIALGVLEGGNGEGGTIFSDGRNKPTIYSHLKNYIDLTDETGLEWGFSHMIGAQNNDNGFGAQVLATDLTLKHNLNANQNLKFQAEAFHLDRDELGSGFKGSLWGAYGLADFRFHPQWSTGLRYDYVQPVDNDRSVNPLNAQIGCSGYLTYYQSEFARWRLQGSHAKLETGEDNDEVLLQGTFAIGEHKHKLQ